MKHRVLAIAAAAEALTGLVLLVYPPIVIKLLFGTNIAGIGEVTSRFAGIALIALAVACWPCAPASRALCGMLTYSSLATLGLLYLALTSEWKGALLWPAIVLHAILTLLLVWAWLQASHATRVPPQL
jgi:hypothetical protein